MAAEQKKQKTNLFELAQKHFAEGRELLEQDLNNARQEKAAIEEKARQEQAAFEERARQEKAAFEEMTKTLNKVHFASTIMLNVGGKIYKTTLDTLRKDPDSMLCAMFSGRFELKADDEDGAYFIDRDAELFRYILNYLRNGELHCPEDRNARNELLAEAKFYQVQEIINQLEWQTSPFEDSLIIENENHHSALISWLPPIATCSLLYRASADGNKPADFHRCCDNKGPTLVVIKSEDYIFGGYTSRSWESADKFKADSQSFLFALISPFGTLPVKITAIPDTDACGGILCKNEMGPCFGNRKYVDLCTLDIAVWGDDHLGQGFRCPANLPDEYAYFTGSRGFEISELEVFEVRKEQFKI